ncbi:hypothetical protein E2C01_091142 [Portunus trituberculatus]|uniref:Uncharacterized protein n=1 Tax=Portunus trituberculatus TaxID=210409 RepID=A0A5B7JN91_PORTR|nr:hypothetical protein [Portunus trituberculatus]
MASWGGAVRSGFGLSILTLVFLAVLPAAGGIKESHTLKFNNLMGPTLRVLYWFSQNEID